MRQIAAFNRCVDCLLYFVPPAIEPDREFCKSCCERREKARREAVEFVAAFKALEIGALSTIPQVRIASAEGRLHPAVAEALGLPTGNQVCATCGMRHWEEGEATDCCASAEAVDRRGRRIAKYEGGFA